VSNSWLRLAGSQAVRCLNLVGVGRERACRCGNLGHVNLAKIPLLVAVVAVLAGCGAPAPIATTTAPSSTAAVPSASATGSASDATCVYSQTSDATKPVSLPSTSKVPNSGVAKYVIDLNGQAVGVSLFRDKTPCTVNSFVSLAAQGYFDKVSCHRLTTAGIYVLQCGDPTGTGSGGPGYEFADELTGSETYAAGTLAMANAGPGTNGSQFFVVYADSTLDPAYTVFGKLDADGLKVVAGIAAGGSDNSNGSGDGRPNLPALINSVKPR